MTMYDIKFYYRQLWKTLMKINKSHVLLTPVCQIVGRLNFNDIMTARHVFSIKCYNMDYINNMVIAIISHVSKIPSIEIVFGYDAINKMSIVPCQNFDIFIFKLPFVLTLNRNIDTKCFSIFKEIKNLFKKYLLCKNIESIHYLRLRTDLSFMTEQNNILISIGFVCNNKNLTNYLFKANGLNSGEYVSDDEIALIHILSTYTFERSLCMANDNLNLCIIEGFELATLEKNKFVYIPVHSSATDILTDSEEILTSNNINLNNTSVEYEDIETSGYFQNDSFSTDSLNSNELGTCTGFFKKQTDKTKVKKYDIENFESDFEYINYNNNYEMADKFYLYDKINNDYLKDE